MLSLRNMIPGNKYLVGDGWGYEIITANGIPTDEEIVERFGEHPGPGEYAKIIDEHGTEDVLFFSNDSPYQIYVEPRN